MRRIMLGALAAATLAAAALHGAAQARAVQAGAAQARAVQALGGDEILSALPRDAAPGACYAKVRVPGETAVAPPASQGAVWVLSPPPPGATGPVWCLVPTAAAPIVTVTPERFGWVRVLCDRDYTPQRIERWKDRLAREGLYRGPIDGRFDEGLREAMARFEALHGLASTGAASAAGVRLIEERQTAYAQTAYAQTAYAQTAYVYAYAPPPQPCCVRPPAPPPALGPRAGGYLDWPGKVHFR